MTNFQLLLDFIPSYPGQNIAVIENSQNELVNSIHNFCKKIDAVLHVKALDKTEILSEQNIKIKSFLFEQARYNNFSVDYDFLFLCVDISQRDDISLIFKKIYRVMKNAGNVFIFVKKDDVVRYFDILEDTNYVALNDIALNETVQVITAKKMHGWRKV